MASNHKSTTTYIDDKTTSLNLFNDAHTLLLATYDDDALSAAMYDDTLPSAMYDDTLTSYKPIDYNELLKSTSITEDIKDFCNLLKNWEPKEVKKPKVDNCPLNILTEKEIEYLITTTNGKKILTTFIDSFSKYKS